MKRRDFLVFSGLGGFGLASVARNLLAQRTPTIVVSENTIPQPTPFRFVTVGDVGMGNNGQYAVAEAMNLYSQRNPFPFVLLVGDNIYGGGEIEKVTAVFEKPYRSLLNKEVRFYAVLGNHDIITNNGEDELKYPGYNMRGRSPTLSVNLPGQLFRLHR